MNYTEDFKRRKRQLGEGITGGGVQQRSVTGWKARLEKNLAGIREGGATLRAREANIADLGKSRESIAATSRDVATKIAGEAEQYKKYGESQERIQRIRNIPALGKLEYDKSQDLPLDIKLKMQREALGFGNETISGAQTARSMMGLPERERRKGRSYEEILKDFGY